MNTRIFDLLYFGTPHPDDGQKWPKNVSATNWENMYHLCILLVFINNYVKSFYIQVQRREILLTWCHILREPELYVFELRIRAVLNIKIQGF
jgi:hypothetical protein